MGLLAATLRASSLRRKLAEMFWPFCPVLPLGIGSALQCPVFKKDSAHAGSSAGCAQHDGAEVKRAASVSFHYLLLM